MSNPRWAATVYYRSDDLGLVDVEHDLVEIEELQDLVEHGPDWNTIEKIEIVLARKSYDGLTLEKARRL